MSEYQPALPYGASYGVRDHPNPTYLPPAYPNQYLQGNDGHTGHIGNNNDTSIGAYTYNSSIPSFSASAVASGIPSLPIYQGWNQDGISLPPYTTPHHPAPYTGYSGNTQENSQYFQTMRQPISHQNSGVAKPFEPNDLSEGEFEDTAALTNTPPVGYSSNYYRGNDGTGYMDTAQRAVYSRAQNYSPQSGYQANHNYPTQNPAQMGRQNSDSYSPYVSSGAAERDDQSEGTQQQNAYASNHNQDPVSGIPHKQYGWTPNVPANRPQQSLYTNGHHTPQTAEGGSQNPGPSRPALGQLASPVNSKSLTESRKKAEAAILNLLPYDVRYQTYIDEGFKEDIVGKLFDDLKMPRTLSKASKRTYAISGSQYFQENKPQSSVQKHNASSSASTNQSLAGGKTGDQNGTSSTVNGPAILVDVSSPSASSTPAQVKSTTMTEKERTLQTKMEALRKSREERAQKAAAKTNGNSSVAPSLVVTAELSKGTETSEKTNSLSKSPTIDKAPLESSDRPVVLQPQTPVNPNSSSQPQTQLVIMQQQPPAIPGLFLASSAVASPAPPVIPEGALHAPVQGHHRKRPVAADFDDALPAMIPHKKPFGYNSQNDTHASLIIDLSEDEDEDVAMDLDSQADQDSPTHSTRKMSDPRTTLQNLPSTNLPTRKPFMSPSTSSANTPSMSHATTKSSLGRPEVLQRKESEIEELKKKIAEAEARKRARQTPSGTRTPRATETNGSDAKEINIPDSSLSSKVAASIKMQKLMVIADDKVTLERQKLADAQAVETNKASELKRTESEQKRLRRAKIESELPLVDAELEQNQAKLEEKRAEIALIEAALQKGLEEKRRLAEEMERLGQETEDQLQTQKHKLETLTRQESESGTDDGPSHPACLSVAEEYNEPPRYVPNIEESGVASEALTNGPSESTPQNSTLNSGPDPTTTSDAKEAGINISKLPESAEEKKSDSNESSETDQALEATLQEVVRAEADSQSNNDNEMDIADSQLASDASQLASQLSTKPLEKDSRSPEYSPVLERTAPEVTDRESDDYEPPDATLAAEAPESPPFSPAPPESIHELADVSMHDINSTQESHEDGQITVDETQPSLDTNSQALLENAVKEDPNKIPLFTPYESPLKQFRAYRFHPEFKQDVPGGLKSTTYSHKIDPNREFCRFELAGGICNDATCDLQHFRDINLQDDAVLTALGNPDEFKGEQRQKFCDGLKQVLTDLRVRKIRDFDIIASEIVAHRSKFLGDKSKVLALEDTTL